MSARPGRVLMTTEPRGGVWAYSLELARGLCERGVEVDLAVLGAPVSCARRDEATACSGLHLHEGAFAVEWMEDPWEDVLRAGEWLMHLAVQRPPDLVHLNHFAHAALPYGRPVVVSAHGCMLSWWDAVKGRAAPACWDRYWYEVARGLRAADMVLAPTRAQVDALQRHYGPLTAVRVVPGARSHDAFGPAAKEPVVLAVSAARDEALNVGALLRAAPRLRAPIRVAGGGGGPSGPGVVHLGELSPEAMADELQRAAIFARPSRYEPFGLSVLEAALCGCALVLGDIPSLRETWGDAACYVDPDDEEGLVEILDTLLAVEGVREEMADRAIRRARRFSPARMARAVLAAYAEVLDRPRALLARRPLQEVRLARGDVLPLPSLGLEPR